jgi:hypothetical protein
MTASLRGTGYSGSVASNGQFSIGAPGGSYTLDMTIPSGYICSTGPLGTGCGGGCPSQSVSSPSVGNNFFFTQHRSAWWQVVGGDIYAGSTGGGTVIRSLIPSSVPANQRHLVLAPDGVVIYRSGSLALNSGDVSAGGYKARAAYKGKKYDFAFWKAQVGVGVNPSNDWAVASHVDSSACGGTVSLALQTADFADCAERNPPITPMSTDLACGNSSPLWKAVPWHRTPKSGPARPNDEQPHWVNDRVQR